MKKSITIIGMLMLLLASMAMAKPFAVENRGAIVNSDVFDSLPSDMVVGVVDNNYDTLGYYGVFDQQGNAYFEFLFVPADKANDAVNFYNSIDRSKIVYRAGYTPTLGFNEGGVWSSGLKVE